MDFNLNKDYGHLSNVWKNVLFVLVFSSRSGCASVENKDCFFNKQSAWDVKWKELPFPLHLLNITNWVFISYNLSEINLISFFTAKRNVFHNWGHWYLTLCNYSYNRLQFPISTIQKFDIINGLPTATNQRQNKKKPHYVISLLFCEIGRLWIN